MLRTLLHRLPEPAKTPLRAVIRATRAAPMQRVVKELRRRGVALGTSRALEVFGAAGNLHVKDYASHVAALEIWECDPSLEAALCANFPDATVKIVDSYREIQTTTGRFDLIVVDNPGSIHQGRCEHFDIIDDLFRVAADPAVIVLQIIPSGSDELRETYPYILNAEQLERRRAFYQTETPDNVSLDTMAAVYTAIARAHGWTVEWHFYQKRHYTFYLLALRITRDARQRAGRDAPMS